MKNKIFLLIGNVSIYAIAYKVFPTQKLQFFLLAIALVIINDLYILLEKK